MSTPEMKASMEEMMKDPQIRAFAESPYAGASMRVSEDDKGTPIINTKGVPDNVLAAMLKTEANLSFQKGDFEGAVRKYSQAISNDLSNAILYSNRSAAYYSLELYGAALDDAERALRLQPSWGKAWGRKAAALLAQHRYDEAIKAYESGLQCGDASKLLQDGHKLALSQKANPTPPPQCSQPLPQGLAEADIPPARVVAMYRKNGGSLPPVWDQGICLGVLGDVYGCLTSLFNAVYLDSRAPALLQPLKSLNGRFTTKNVMQILLSFVSHRWNFPSHISEKALSNARLSIHVMSNFFNTYIAAYANDIGLNPGDEAVVNGSRKAIIEELEQLIRYVEDARAQASPSNRAAADALPHHNHDVHHHQQQQQEVILWRLSVAEDDEYPLWAISRQLLSFFYTFHAKWNSFLKPYNEKKILESLEKARDLDPCSIATLGHSCTQYDNGGHLEKIIEMHDRLQKLAPEDEEFRTSSSYEACYAQLYLASEARPLAMRDFRAAYLHARDLEAKSRPIWGSNRRAVKQKCKEMFNNKNMPDDVVVGLNGCLARFTQYAHESEEVFRARVKIPSDIPLSGDFVNREKVLHCNKCSKISLKMQMCSGCKGVHYCSRTCQAEDWKKHKHSCGKNSKGAYK
eukprot:TRINITY_DN5689_c0_g1_i5.p1 TRINITY_DN5689_c0_g1~~TRINITY_DN5689_c0_g1_i5.p1  ORF type:complete len:670 (+),score=50.33 TRINITY_DN5689_c0_g1_i5:118-2010(+)